MLITVNKYSRINVNHGIHILPALKRSASQSTEVGEKICVKHVNNN